MVFRAALQLYPLYAISSYLTFINYTSHCSLAIFTLVKGLYLRAIEITYANAAY